MRGGRDDRQVCNMSAEAKREKISSPHLLGCRIQSGVNTPIENVDLIGVDSNEIKLNRNETFCNRISTIGICALTVLHILYLHNTHVFVESRFNSSVWFDRHHAGGFFELFSLPASSAIFAQTLFFLSLGEGLRVGKCDSRKMFIGVFDNDDIIKLRVSKFFRIQTKRDTNQFV